MFEYLNDIYPPHKRRIRPETHAEREARLKTPGVDNVRRMHDELRRKLHYRGWW